ncbi:MAG: hypothetical protein ACLVKS_00695 [Peptococcus niger]
MHLGKDITAGLRDIFGGRSASYEGERCLPDVIKKWSSAQRPWSRCGHRTGLSRPP